MFLGNLSNKIPNSLKQICITPITKGELFATVGAMAKSKALNLNGKDMEFLMHVTSFWVGVH